MAIAFVRDYGHANGAGTGTVYTRVVTMTAGNMAVISVGWPAASGAVTVSTVTDSAGNTWSAVPGSFAHTNIFSADTAIQIWTTPIVTGGSVTISVTFSTSINLANAGIVGTEFSGVVGVDQSNSRGTTDVVVSLPTATRVANEVVWSYFLTNNSSATEGAGWTRSYQDAFNLTEYKIVSAAGTYTSTTTGSSQVFLSNTVTLIAPPTFVRKFAFQRNAGSNTTSSQSGVTFDTGDLVAMTVIWYNITIGSTITDTITVADSNGNAWYKVAGTFRQQAIGGGTGFDSIGEQLWYSVITNGGSGITATATFPANVNYPGFYGVEAANVNTIDQLATAQSASAPVNSGNITTTVVNTFIYGSLYDDNQTGTAMGANWTLLDNAFNNYYHGYRIPGAIVTQAANTNSGANNRFIAEVISFKFVVAIQYIQSASNSASNTASTTCTYGLNNTLNNFLSCLVRVYNNGGGPGAITVSDSQSNTWLQAGSTYVFSGLGNHAVFYCKACVAGANTVTVSCANNAGANYPSLSIFEHSGVDSASPYITQTSSTGTGTAISSGNITTSDSTDLLLAISSNITNTVTETSGSGWTQRQYNIGQHIASDQTVFPKVYSYTGTDNISVTWGATVASFKVASAIVFVGTSYAFIF